LATKSKNWTARRLIKTCCVILIPVLLFISTIGVIEINRLGYVSETLLFSKLDENDYFFDNYIPNAISWAQSLFFLQSEEHIRDMGCLEWRQYEVEEYDYYGNPTPVVYFRLVSTSEVNQWDMGTINAKDIDTIHAKQIVNNAIQQQLDEFHYAKNRLDETPGLHYFISDGERRIGNVPPDTGAEFFRKQPVYWIAETGKAYEQSRNGSDRYNNPYPYPYPSYSNYYNVGYGRDSISSYIAFSSGVVDWQNGVWREAQRQLEIQLMVIGIPVIVSLALTIILMVGAGRRYNGEADKIYFTALDKPWLDIGLGLLAGYETIVCYAFYEVFPIALRYDNFKWIYALCAFLSILLVLPLLSWVVSFMKYCKAGKWWRHTLLYVLIHGVFSRIKHFIKSLWAGFPLTLKAAALGVGVFVFTALCVGVYPSAPMLLLAFAFSVLVVFGLLRYTRKLHLLELGAKAASGGRYDIPIAVTGGELGSIAASIKNISDGINVAVTERLKSERFRTELITNISHDIRTPLTSLITFTDLLKNEGLGAEKAPEYLEILIQKSARLKTLTDDLFEASKAASGNIDAHIGALDLADFVRQALGELDERVRESGLDFRLNLPEHATVLADGKLLWRVMDNLLSNVFKYAVAGSRVYIDIAADDSFEYGTAKRGEAGVKGGVRNGLEGGAEYGTKYGSGFEMKGGAEGGSEYRTEYGTKCGSESGAAGETEYGTEYGTKCGSGFEMKGGAYRLDIKNISEHPLNVEPSELIERFKRGDEARSGEGSGLGLSIAQSFVIAQGGRFTLSIDGDLFKVSIHLPKP